MCEPNLQRIVRENIWDGVTIHRESVLFPNLSWTQYKLVRCRYWIGKCTRGINEHDTNPSRTVRGMFGSDMYTRRYDTPYRPTEDFTVIAHLLFIVSNRHNLPSLRSIVKSPHRTPVYTRPGRGGRVCVRAQLREQLHATRARSKVYVVRSTPAVFLFR
jgi:hypothetical protein